MSQTAEVIPSSARPRPIRAPYFGEPGWPSRRALIGGAFASGSAGVFLLFDAVLKLARPPEAVLGTTQLGYSADIIRPLGMLELLLLTLYLVPRTRVLGAVLWTGYLGGAVATHLRVGAPWASHTLFPVYLGVLLWGGLWLRDSRVRSALLAP